MGWGGVLNETPPAENLDVTRAFHCWRFCGNAYRPDLLPMYAAMYDVPDPYQMVELLITIRDKTNGN